MAKILGIMTAALLALTFGKYVWRRVPVLKKHSTSMKWMVSVHPYAAGSLVVIGLAHGIKAYGLNFLFSGHVLLFFSIGNMIIGVVLNRKIRKSLLTTHRRLSYIMIGLLLIHNLFKFSI